MPKNQTPNVTKVDTLAALAIVARTGGADPDQMAERASVLLGQSVRRTMVDTVLTWYVVGASAISAFRTANPDPATKVTDAAVLKHHGLMPGSDTTFHGFSRTTVGRGITAANFVVLNDDGTLAHLADFETACETDTTRSATSAIDYITWRANTVDPSRTSNRAGGGKAGGNRGTVKAFTVGKAERAKAVEALAKADVTARPVADAPVTWADLRLLTDADLRTLAAAIVAEIDRRAGAPDPSVPAMPDFTKMTKAQIVAWQQSMSAAK